MKSSTIITILVILAVAGGAYWYFFGNSGTVQSTTLTTNGAASTNAQAQFQALASELKTISLDTKVLTDPRFTVLVDLTTPIAPVPKGRTDPFAPLGGS